MSILIFEHTDTCGAERLATTLRNYGHRLRILRLHDGDEVPNDIDDVDGVITCGGPQSANDDSNSWLARQMELLNAVKCNLMINTSSLGTRSSGGLFSLSR